MQVNDERLKGIITKATESGDMECPNGIECKGWPNQEKCIACWYGYLKERIW